MADPRSAPARKTRADADRNRRQLLEAAGQAFAEAGAGARLEEIARRAGVGIGTLYRHFPTRDALLAEVYHQALRQLAEAAPALLELHPPLEALRRWMMLFIDYLATKKVIAPALATGSGGASALHAGAFGEIRAAIALLVARAAARGEIVDGVDPLDLLRAVIGVATIDGTSDWQDGARRLVGILVAGLRRPGGGS